MSKLNNNKKKIIHTNKGHKLPVQGYFETSQPNKLNNHQPRAGTKQSRKHYCNCEYCRSVPKIGLKEKELEKDKEKQIKEIEEDNRDIDI